MKPRTRLGRGREPADTGDHGAPTVGMDLLLLRLVEHHGAPRADLFAGVLHHSNMVLDGAGEAVDENSDGQLAQ